HHYVLLGHLASIAACSGYSIAVAWLLCHPTRRTRAQVVASLVATRAANATSWMRVVTRVLRIRLVTCASTVRGERNSRAATSALDSPSATRVRTSISRL